MLSVIRCSIIDCYLEVLEPPRFMRKMIRWECFLLFLTYFSFKYTYSVRTWTRWPIGSENRSATKNLKKTCCCRLFILPVWDIFPSFFQELRVLVNISWIVMYWEDFRGMKPLWYKRNISPSLWIWKANHGLLQKNTVDEKYPRIFYC